MMTEFIQNPLWFYLLIANLYLFGLMGYDKYQAVRKKWRVPEWNLLFMGLIGGGIGGLIAQRVFHHKTRKRKFYIFFAFGVIVDLLLFIKFA
ncbi:DUF1294 domain-containing protein [Enterococcus gallinarum]|jgi:uncharacterized membrane protein YsdA (DUF1294 family)|nr:membrane protein [Enterococcus gallinarum]GMS48538.1 DUF1294 domain-containing protein [Enterococcus gallinarum]GMS51683.1 DUF1294 domain-containing protein [Enterococcus gallinarum]